jgi:ribose/xylose/arabinose/galactoside ABC-type transport system permease subunit
MAPGWELDAITAAVLGGTDIFGGRGTIFGTVIAFFLMTLARTGMGLADIKIEKQMVAIGLLLLFSIVLPNLLQRRRA